MESLSLSALEAAACECFQINVNAYQLLLGSSLGNSNGNGKHDDNGA